MTDGQFNTLIAAIVAGLAGVGAVIKWSVGRIVKAIDANSASMIENTKSNAVLATKIDHVTAYIQAESERDQESPHAKKRTPPTGTPIGGGYYPPRRPSTRGGDE
jgi:hypothetical protein